MIENYIINEKIYEGRTNVVYKATRQPDQLQVIIKTSISDYPTSEDLDHLRHEYNIINSLNIDGVIKPYGIEKYGNRLILVLEDFNGVTLKDFIILKTKKNISITKRLKDFLIYSIQIINTLELIHLKGVIHKDINSYNILVNPDTGIVKITDFCLATFEEKSMDSPRLLQGHIAYISPEQTGRLDIATDYRSDLYSLGVVLYEMLTLKLPFEYLDPMELVHCHLTVKPIPPHKINSSIPVILSKIISKLLSKHPDKRYQSANSLKHDIKHCLNTMTKSGKIKTFKLGSHDISSILNIPVTLYGRTNEINKLISINHRVIKEGRFETVFITGHAGTGKSSLIEEFYKRSGSKFYFGKYDQFLKDIPYSAITQAFTMFVRYIISQGDVEIEKWKARILNGVGSYGRILTDIIPEFLHVIGSQPDVPNLPPDKAQNRFHYIFQKFLESIIDIDHPLVIFLDDIHWADHSSLHLLEHIFLNTTYPYLLIICAYRDNEVIEGHPLIKILEQSDNRQGINYINIQPLEETYVETMISDMIPQSDSTRELSEIIYQKSGGNPFFIHQLIKTLQFENLINIDVNSGIWKWDIDKIESLDISDNVVTLMIRRIQSLPPQMQYILNYAACMGKNFSIDTLSNILRMDKDRIEDTLRELISNGLIIQKDNKYSFPHDRIEQAAYMTIPEVRRKKIHHEIGTYLLDTTEESELQIHIFNIVGHLNKGYIEKNNYKKIIQLNLISGNTALNSSAFEAGVGYFDVGMRYFTEDLWETDYDLAYGLFKGIANCHLKAGNIETAAKHTDTLLEKSRTDMDKAEILYIHISQLDYLGIFNEAIVKIREALTLFDVYLPDNEEQARIEANNEIRRVKEYLQDKEVEDLINLPLMADPKMKLFSKYFTFLNPYNVAGKYETVYLLGIKSLNNSIQFGNSESSVTGYLGYAMNLIRRREYELGYRFGLLSIKLTEKLKDKEYKTFTLHTFGQFINHWKNHIKSSIIVLENAELSSLESGDNTFKIFAIVVKFFLEIFLGIELTNLQNKYSKIYIIEISFVKSIYNHFLTMLLAFTSNLTGKTHTRLSLNTNEVNEDDFLEKIKEVPVYLYYYKILKLVILFIYGSYGDAFKITIEIIKNINYLSTRYVTTEVYFYYAMCIAQLFPQFSDEEKIHYSKEFDDAISKMKLWADNCPENFFHKYLLMSAEKARIEGNDLKAMELYDRAIDFAKQNGFLTNEAQGNELAGVYYLNIGRVKIAKVYMIEARYLYNQWGATEKVKDLQERYPDLLMPDMENRQIAITEITLREDSIFLDRLAVIKASQAISSELDMSKLLEKIIKILMEHSGADRCVVIEKQENEFIIIAQSIADDDKIDVYQSKPLSNLPLSVITYTLRTLETLISNDSKSEQIFNGDTYFKNKTIGSVLCLPVISKSKTSYCIYLENSVLNGVFNSNKLEIINILLSQASISLDASRVFKEILTYKKIVSTSAEHLSIVDRNYKYKVVNDAYLEAHNRKIEDIVGHAIPELLGQDIFNGVIKKRIDQCFLGETINFKSFFEFKGIGRKYMDVYYYPSYEEDGSINQIVVNARDITSIKNYEDELKRYSARILSAQDDERKRIAMELHDGLSQSLLLIKMKVQGRKNSIDRDIISDISSIIEELRNITMNLRPAFLERVNLVNVIIWYSKQLEERSKLTLKVFAPIDFDVTPIIKEHLFRIYQEALNNILKHSGADYVSIEVIKENDTVILTIKDNGKGFIGLEGKDAGLPQKISNSGLGLFTMKERAEFLHGTFEIKSNTKGSSIIIKVPIDDKS